VGADSPSAAINPATAAAPDVVSYWRADPADLVTLTIVKLPEQDTELRWQAAILHQAPRDISAWPVSDMIHAAWRYRAIKVDAIVDLHRTSSPGSNANGRTTFRAKYGSSRVHTTPSAV